MPPRETFPNPLPEACASPLTKRCLWHGPPTFLKPKVVCAWDLDRRM